MVRKLGVGQHDRNTSWQCVCVRPRRFTVIAVAFAACVASSCGGGGNDVARSASPRTTALVAQSAEAPYASGVIDSHQSVLTNSTPYRTENQWAGTVGDQWVQVYVGGVSTTPTVVGFEPTGDGFVYLLRNPAAVGGGPGAGWKPSGGTFVAVPPGTGSLRVEAATGAQLTLATTTGMRFVFDVASGALSAAS
jgi:hypothetical protein